MVSGCRGSVFGPRDSRWRRAAWSSVGRARRRSASACTAFCHAPLRQSFLLASAIGATLIPATMTNQVLIVAARPAAKAPAEIVTSLRFTPVIAESEQEALDLLDRQPFRLIAVSGRSGWQRLREAAERKQPMARVLELPEGNGPDRMALRSLIVRNLDPAHRPPGFRQEERYRSLATILEAFTGSLELREVLRSIVAL